MSYNKWIFRNLLACLFLAYSGGAWAQSSFKEVEKMRKEEDKRRAKLAKDKAKKAQKVGETDVPEDTKTENNIWQEGKKKSKGVAQSKKTPNIHSRKNKKNVPKAAQNLSRQRQSVNSNTAKYRKNGGVTKAAKSQSKNRKRVKIQGGTEVW